ncbi:TPA: NAD(P)-dependent oxidoreductase [Candidatus Gastranaerophilales bacterium HUM_20]|nr:3-oxoacyl-[acyl-carrier protein] reductase [Clostridium sp. CAG:729]DAB24513.1 MAG TPA: NAD(P)-dependent oxidoreductase [Candidatus Gastranaerophilales bacterium HUM_20]
MNILVTGASKGIGNAIAKELEKSGNLYVTGRNEEALRECICKDYCVCDLANDIEILAEFIEKNKIDILINNAGEYIYGALETMSTNDIQRIYQTNLISPAYLISKAIPAMKNNKWGRIINIGSISGVMGEAYASLYSSSKAGLIGLTKALALELAEYNITVNTINPGWVETELGMNSIDESEFSKDEIIECIPQKRFVKPEEVAKLCKYLISEDAKGITGQSINLCAGLSVGI